MSTPAFAPASTPDTPAPTRFARWQHLALVLWVSISMPILGSLYYLFRGTAATASMYQSYRLWGGLVQEASGLLVLWYVMRHQGRTWRDIGWNPSFADIPRALGLFLAATAATWVVYIPA